MGFKFAAKVEKTYRFKKLKTLYLDPTGYTDYRLINKCLNGLIHFQEQTQKTFNSALTTYCTNKFYFCFSTFNTTSANNLFIYENSHYIINAFGNAF